MGIMLGDGSIYDGSKVKRIEIVMNRNEISYVENFVSPLIKSIFKIEPKIRSSGHGKNAIGIYANSKKMVVDSKEMGLVPGNKIKNQVGIPKWIFSKRNYIIACVRGLIDTDGCLFKRNENKRPRIEFYTSSVNLANDFIIAVNSLGIKCSQRKYKNKFICGIYSWREVRKFIQIVGFNNINHLSKLNQFNMRP